MSYEQVRASCSHNRQALFFNRWLLRGISPPGGGPLTAVDCAGQDAGSRPGTGTLSCGIRSHTAEHAVLRVAMGVVGSVHIQHHITALQQDPRRTSALHTLSNRHTQPSAGPLPHIRTSVHISWSSVSARSTLRLLRTILRASALSSQLACRGISTPPVRN